MPSPFYPGYVDDGSTKPPYFPGYYVGDPLARPPKYTGGLEPTEFAPDPMTNFASGLEYDLKNFIGFGTDGQFIPPYWREQIAADFKRTLNAVGEPSSSGTDYQSAMEQGDLNEGIGAQIKLNINPADFLEDPGKWVTNTVKDFGVSIFNKDDFSDWLENKYLWAPLIAGTAAGSTTEHDKLGGFSPADAVARAAFYAGKDVIRNNVGGTDVIVTPLQLNLDEFAENVDVGNLVGLPGQQTRMGIAQKYRKVGESYLAFVEDVNAFGKREGNFSDLQAKILDGAAEELNKLSASGDIPAAFDDSVKFLDARVGVMKALDDISGKEGLKAINSTLAANFLERQEPGIDPITGAQLPPGSVDAPGKLIYDRLLGGWTKTDANGLNPSVKPGLIVSLRSAITSGEAGLNASQLKIYRQQNAEILNFAKQLEAFANKHKNLSAQAVWSDGGLLMGTISHFNNELNRPGIFRGIQDKYVNTLMQDLAGGKHGIKEIQALLKAHDPNYLVGMDNSLRVYKIAQRFFNRAEVTDIAGHIEGGKLIRNYLYNQRFINRFMGYTPAALSKEFLQRVHYFGLSYNPDYDGKKILWVIPAAKFFGNMPWCGENKFNISYNIGGISKSLKFTGHSDFSAAAGLFKAMKKPANTNLMNEMLTDFWSDAGAGRAAFIDKFAKEGISYYKFNKFREILKNKFGLTTGVALDPAKKAELLSFLEALQKYDAKNYNLSITLAKAGLLQHVAAGASKVQSWFYQGLDKIGIGKLLSAYYQLKNAVAEAIAQGITKFLEWAAAALSFGGGTMLAPILEVLERVIKWVILWTWEKFENLFKAIVSGDLLGYWKGLEKGMNNIIKVSLYILMIPLILGGLVMFMMGTVLSTIPSVSPARTDQVSGGAAAISASSYAICSQTSQMPNLNASANNIAGKAYDIVSGLERGVWCLWNKSSAYPELWNPPADYPACNPASCSDPGPTGIFWCTWLVIKAYPDVPNNLLNANNMLNYFKNTRGHGFYSPGSNIANKIASGDVIFSQTQPGKGTDGYHVEVIYKVNLDTRGNGYIITVNSNSNEKSHNYTVLSGIVQSLPGLPHAGIGKQ